MSKVYYFAECKGIRNLLAVDVFGPINQELTLDEAMKEAATTWAKSEFTVKPGHEELREIMVNVYTAEVSNQNGTLTLSKGSWLVSIAVTPNVEPLNDESYMKLMLDEIKELPEEFQATMVHIMRNIVADQTNYEVNLSDCHNLCRCIKTAAENYAQRRYDTYLKA